MFSMKDKKFLLISGIAALLLFSSSCAENAQIQRLNEKQIAALELVAEQARQKFYCGQYDQVAPLVEGLCQEKTTSQPLYLCELGTSYLACNDKQNAKKYLLDAYTSIEGFFDPASEKKAISFWGSEAEKVYKGEPYEQASLSLFVGLLLLEEGDVDNALSCFKSGQLADSDVENEQFQSDFGLLQLLEAKCYQMRGEQAECDQFTVKAVDSFARTHPFLYSERAKIVADNLKSNASEQEKAEILEIKVMEAKEKLVSDCHSYYGSLLQQYNTLLLIWTGRSPEIRRTGQYGEGRILIKNPPTEKHYEVQVDDSNWHDVICGFANVSYQATTRGGRAMDNVLSNQAEFKRSTHQAGKSFIDAANNTSDPYATLFLLGAGLIAEGLSAATNVKADIRCWKTLPSEIAVVPLQLTAGTHKIRIDCYNKNLKLNRSQNYQIDANGQPFQFYNLVVPAMIPPESDEI
jgi:hypothetical protein